MVGLGLMGVLRFLSYLVLVINLKCDAKREGIHVK